MITMVVKFLFTLLPYHNSCILISMYSNCQYSVGIEIILYYTQPIENMQICRNLQQNQNIAMHHEYM